MQGGDNFNHDWRNTSNKISGINKGKNVAKEYISQEQYFPLLHIDKLMYKALPCGAKVSSEAKELVQLVLSEYISFITSEANNRSALSLGRSTIRTEDLLEAMKYHSFNHHVDLLTSYRNGHLHLSGNTTPAPTTWHVPQPPQMSLQAPSRVHVLPQRMGDGGRQPPYVLVQEPIQPPMNNIPVYPRLGFGCLSMEAINNFTNRNYGSRNNTSTLGIGSSSSFMRSNVQAPIPPRNVPEQVWIQPQGPMPPIMYDAPMHPQQNIGLETINNFSNGLEVGSPSLFFTPEEQALLEAWIAPADNVRDQQPQPPVVAQASVNAAVPMPLVAKAPICPQVGADCLNLESLDEFSNNHPSTRAGTSTSTFEIGFGRIGQDAVIDIDPSEDAMMDFDPDIFIRDPLEKSDPI